MGESRRLVTLVLTVTLLLVSANPAFALEKLLKSRSSSEVSAEELKSPFRPGTIAYEAIQYLGVPYKWGGVDPKSGLDCSGLVVVVFQKLGKNLPHYSRAQAQLGTPVSYNELQPGDLVFFGSPIHHVGIYLGEGYYIQAPKKNDVVKISKLSDRNDFACARRVNVGPN